MLCAVKHKRGCLINRHSTRTGCCIGYLASMQTERIEIVNMILGQSDVIRK